MPTKPQKPGANLASCIVATIFLIFVIIVILIVFFTVFKPKDPSITVNTVQVPNFSVSDASDPTNGTVNFTFSQYVSVKNPNRASFTHYDSSLQLLYAGNQVGFMFIPAGKIESGRTEYMAATFSVQSFPFMANRNPAAVADLSGSLEIESRLQVRGRVSVLHVFTHHVEGRSRCQVSIAVSDGSVLGFHC